MCYINSLLIISTIIIILVNADQLWKGCTSVSPAGRRKGRARAVKKARDLNRGQIIGCGKYLFFPFNILLKFYCIFY